MTSRGFLSDSSMKFLRRSQKLTGVRKTAHARRNGFILTEFPRAIFVQPRGEQEADAEGLAWWLLAQGMLSQELPEPWSHESHWLTGEPGANLLTFFCSPVVPTGNEGKGMTSLANTCSSEKTNYNACSICSLLCHLACLLWSEGVHELLFDILSKSLSISRWLFSRRPGLVCALAKPGVGLLYVVDIFCFLVSNAWNASEKCMTVILHGAHSEKLCR